jgi:hypothetical protein
MDAAPGAQVVLTMMLTTDRRSAGIALLVEAIVPLGDMSIILGSGGSKSRAFSIPVYLRGEAYLAAKQGAAAATEFQKNFDHSGVVGNEPIGALAHLGLARAYA